MPPNMHLRTDFTVFSEIIITHYVFFGLGGEYIFDAVKRRLRRRQGRRWQIAQKRRVQGIVSSNAALGRPPSLTPGGSQALPSPSVIIRLQVRYFAKSR
jgi:hypothetical protein